MDAVDFSLQMPRRGWPCRVMALCLALALGSGTLSGCTSTDCGRFGCGVLALGIALAPFALAKEALEGAREEQAYQEREERQLAQLEEAVRRGDVRASQRAVTAYKDVWCCGKRVPRRTQKLLDQATGVVLHAYQGRSDLVPVERLALWVATAVRESKDFHAKPEAAPMAPEDFRETLRLGQSQAMWGFARNPANFDAMPKELGSNQSDLNEWPLWAARRMQSMLAREWTWRVRNGQTQGATPCDLSRFGALPRLSGNDAGTVCDGLLLWWMPPDAAKQASPHITKPS